MRRLLVLRPEPGASQTVAAAHALGLEAVAAPLFALEAVAWSTPAGRFDALMLTSANAVRFGGDGLAAFRSFPVYAVGEATAAVARQAGFHVMHAGAGGAAELVAAMRAAGVRHALHLSGEVHRDVPDPGIGVDRVIVYRSAPVDRLSAQPEDMVALIHSPDAGCLFARLIDGVGVPRSRVTIAAISPAAAARTGDGWAAVGIAPRPSDAALLAIARELCEGGVTGSDG